MMKGKKVTEVCTINQNIIFCFLLASQPATDKQLYAIIVSSTLQHNTTAFETPGGLMTASC